MSWLLVALCHLVTEYKLGRILGVGRLAIGRRSVVRPLNKQIQHLSSDLVVTM